MQKKEINSILIIECLDKLFAITIHRRLNFTWFMCGWKHRVQNQTVVIIWFLLLLFLVSIISMTSTDSMYSWAHRSKQNEFLIYSNYFYYIAHSFRCKRKKIIIFCYYRLKSSLWSVNTNFVKYLKLSYAHFDWINFKFVALAPEILISQIKFNCLLNFVPNRIQSNTRININKCLVMLTTVHKIICN